MNDQSHPISQALFPVLRGICRDHSSLDLEERQNGSGLRLTATCALDDYRILVGKSGRNVNAIKRLVARAGDKCQIKAEFSLRTNERGDVCDVHDFKADPMFDESLFILLLTKMCEAIEVDFSHSNVRLREDGKMCVVIPAAAVEDRAAIADLNSLFYSFGYTSGRKIDIKTTGPDDG